MNWGSTRLSSAHGGKPSWRGKVEAVVTVSAAMLWTAVTRWIGATLSTGGTRWTAAIPSTGETRWTAVTPWTAAIRSIAATDSAAVRTQRAAQPFRTA